MNSFVGVEIVSVSPNSAIKSCFLSVKVLSYQI